ncbi:hypothetical protein WA026_020685 [Henosepilachna vigintioctopunctata]|uniref:Uncharacterized protein n=1 Tax=Henosepilachna vigintioctopunctata TaxID=420089 RepID=A0AAW1UD55_9CUCU
MLQNLSFGYLRDDNMAVNEKFRIFHQNFVDCYSIAFPERFIKVRARDFGVRWFTRELKRLRNQMVFIQDLYKLHNSPELRTLRNKFRLQYRLAIKRKKIAENDKLIKNALNLTKLIWSLINNRRNIRKQRNYGNISPNDFM